MDEIKLSRDYVAAFRAAYAIKNIDEMFNIFQSLLSEIGIPDSSYIAAQQAYGKAAAELLNARDRGIGGKKI
ncbi:MAG TPA: hypothetical protein PLO24_00815 [Bacteroidales bacterium]|nr:hypothetical protein [Bacteroidales bacterium]HOS71114.1 hypothetical protein [Bacteroidales bacterium]HQH23588.1 hypothetical protein [Bacteroidales bacterium]HQJ81110.1 hypothetical protein [Bacteroidales bacterium]